MKKKKIEELIEAVGYLRLSRDDGEDESTSITNQRAIIDDWARSNGFIITEWYIDDGYSGYSMDRPDFNRLKKDLNDGKIKVIISKHLSRIGRKGSEVNLFLENIQEDGHRVITISDGYDTFDERTHDMLGINTWVNEKYIRDTSKNIRSAIERMQKEGRYISQVPYGYELDLFVKGKYYIDKTCAIHVQEIFDMYLNGHGAKAIARILTERQVPTHSQNTKMKMERRGQVYKKDVTNVMWSQAIILKILRNDFYIGVLTLGKSKRRTINGKTIKQSEENLIRFEDAHEPIIDKQTFKLAQEILAERTHSNYRSSEKGPTVFAGKLFCADCGTRLTPSRSAKTQRYVCRKYHTMGTDYCTSHSINDSHLTASLMYFLEHCRNNLAEAISDLKIESRNKMKDYQRDSFEILQKDQGRIEKEIEVLIEQKMRETISNPTMKEFIDKTYANMINAKYAELQSVSERINEIEEDTSKDMDLKKELSSVLDIFDEIISGKTLKRRHIETIVEKIVVHDDNGLDIFLKGDLHELCTNYVQFKNTNKELIIKEMVEYLEKNSDQTIVKKKCEAYVRAQGVRFDTKIFSKLYDNMIQAGYLKEIAPRRGCTVVDAANLKQALESNTITTYSRRIVYLSVTIQFLHKVCKWYNDTKPRYKKY
jgi:DNA invertase Pin-like site-specific DNA recombinase